MTTQILGYRKTDHFLYRQWDRSIHDQILYKILPYIQCTNCTKDIIIVSASFLKRNGVKVKENKSLVIIASKNVLSTCYWCDYPEYLLIKEPYSHFQKLK